MTIDTAGTDVMNIHPVGVGAMDERPEEWLERLFEYEYCAECGGDAPDHEVCIVPGMGTYFARCKRTDPGDQTNNGSSDTSGPPPRGLLSREATPPGWA